jgi:hypothetical protein
MSVFDTPSAASRIAFARTTSRYGPEYAAARRSSSRRCSSLKTTWCGDVCAITTEIRHAGYDSFKLAGYFRRRPLRGTPHERRDHVVVVGRVLLGCLDNRLLARLDWTTFSASIC